MLHRSSNPRNTFTLGDLHAPRWWCAPSMHIYYVITYLCRYCYWYRSAVRQSKSHVKPSNNRLKSEYEENVINVLINENCSANDNTTINVVRLTPSASHYVTHACSMSWVIFAVTKDVRPSRNVALTLLNWILNARIFDLTPYILN
jgi:hypothetical protein